MLGSILKVSYNSGGVITLMIGPFTLSHLWLVLLNRTTIENSQFQTWQKSKSNQRLEIFTNSGKNIFNQGYQKNWKEVMGDNWVLWFCKYIMVTVRYMKCTNIYF
jgi:hypothetical protein